MVQKDPVITEVTQPLTTITKLGDDQWIINKVIVTNLKKKSDTDSCSGK